MNVHVYMLMMFFYAGTPLHKIFCPRRGVREPTAVSILLHVLSLRVRLLPEELVIVNEFGVISMIWPYPLVRADGLRHQKSPNIAISSVFYKV